MAIRKLSIDELTYSQIKVVFTRSVSTSHYLLKA
jgi:hypothetical protein